MDSIELARFLAEKEVYGASKIIFVIGGSNGLSEEVIKRANFKLSFSKFTFPHQLMRLILAEQIYRSLTINHHKEYHK
jgi:23S rRNA (pseudouridine1915-N3)-methyltransferase